VPRPPTGYLGGVDLKHPADDRRGRFDDFAESASNFTSSPLFFAVCLLAVAAWVASFAFGDVAHHAAGDFMAAITLLLVALLKNAERRAEGAIQQKLDAIAAALLEQRRGNKSAAQDELAEAIGLHDEV
jgi:low affinity Fe/Cu permease